MLLDAKKVSFADFFFAALRFEKLQWVQTKFNFITCQFQEFENHAAQTDGARQELVNRASTARPVHRIEVITEAEEHAQGLFRATMELQQ